MTVCAACGAENPGKAKFCMECGAPLAAPAAAAEERKIVTTLFCDLVAFTAMSEAADPEDVDALLRTYHAAARKVIESHGGTVEKFIGDAVVEASQASREEVFASTRRRRPASPTPPRAGTTSACPTKKGTPCLAKGAAW